MKKSEIYVMAMKAVLRTDFREDVKIEILEVLMENKGTAEFTEKREAAEAEVNKYV